MYPLKQSTGLTVPFFVHDSSGNGVTGLTDANFTKRISKNGAAFGAMTVTITEMENGWYSLPLDTGHTDTLGILTISLINSGGGKRINLQFRVSLAGPDANLVQINGDSTASTNATLNLKQLNIVNTAGDALVASSTGSNGRGINASGNGTGEGIRATGGTNGEGIEVIGGSISGDGATFRAATFGVGLRCTASGNNPAIQATGGGTGSGIKADGGATGHGISAAGGPTSGDGINASATSGNGTTSTGGTNGHGARVVGAGTGEGISAQGGATGHGIETTGGATSGAGIVASAAAGNSHGIIGTGSGTSSGLAVFGGENGNGVLAQGGDTSGDGLRLVAANGKKLDSADVTGAVATDGANSATSFKTTLTQSVNDYWKDAFCRLTSGTLIHQVKRVTGYNGTTKFLTVAGGFTSTPADAVTFELVNE